MAKVLTKKFFDRPTLEVAQELLGKFLVRKYQGTIISSMITEVEAYDGPHDKAAHGSKGLTPRNKALFGEAGHWYVYFIYGIYWMLNTVCGKEGYPAGVLIRGVQDISGPGRLTRLFYIDGSFNGRSISKSSDLWIEDRGLKVNDKQIVRSKRIGVDYAGKYWAGRLYRFNLVADS